MEHKEDAPLLRDEGGIVPLLSRLGDLVILNLLWLVCCLPVVTIGAATSALYFTMLKMQGHEENGILRTYFHGFRINWKQATALWLLLLAAIIVVGTDLVYGWQHKAEAVGLAVLLTGAVLALLLVCEAVWVFPLQARFEGTLRQHLVNSIGLFRLYVPQSLGVLLLWSAAAVCTLCFTGIRYQLFWLWLTCGFSGLFYLSSWVFRGIFDSVQLQNDQNGQNDAKGDPE